MAAFTCKWYIFILCSVMAQWSDHLSDEPTAKDKSEDPHRLSERTAIFGSGYELFSKAHQRRDLHQLNIGIQSRKKTESSQFGFRYKRQAPTFCGYRCNTEGLPTCYCDAACHDFNDCCSSSDGKVKSDSIHVENMVCKSPHNSHTQFVSKYPFGVWMKGNCSKEVGKSISTKCLGTNSTDDPLEIVPVTDKNGISYPNIFCAICNGAEDASPWDLRAMYRKVKDIQAMRTLSEILQFLNQNTLVTSLPSKFIKPRICVLAEKPTIQNNGSSTGDPCFKYQQPVYFNQTLVRNSQCIGNLSEKCSAMPQTDPCTPKCLKPMSQTYREYATPRFTTPAVIIELGPQFKLEYDSTKCKPHDLISDSEVSCVHFGCLRSPDVPVMTGDCNRYNTMYENKPVEFTWFFRGDLSADYEGLRRYVTMIYYVLLVNNVVSDRDYFQYHPMNSDITLCNSKAISLRLHSRKIISWNEFLKIQRWAKSLQFSYTEKTATTEKSFSRDLGQHSSSSCPMNSTLSIITNTKRIFLATDMNEMYQSVAKYRHSFLLKENCKMVYLNMSLQEQRNKNGLTEIIYKPLQFYCSNGFLLLRNQLWYLGACMIISKLF